MRPHGHRNDDLELTIHTRGRAADRRDERRSTSERRRFARRHLFAAALLCASAGCRDDARQRTTDTPISTARIHVVRESFATPRNHALDIDSPAVWHGPDGEHWLLSTAKRGDLIRISDAATGAHLADVGGSGKAVGRLDRPNGIAVLDDVLWVVERNNRRVQLFTLPDLKPLGAFGEDVLLTPYGIALHRAADGAYVAYITDNYELTGDARLPDRYLGGRVRQYRVTLNGAMHAEHVRAIGETRGAGVLRVVESIAVDPQHRRLLIADESPGASTIKVYDTDGSFTGTIIDARYFPHQSEGIALYACDDGGGYWIATDQAPDESTFHIFDRASLGYITSFRGTIVQHTDGVALTQTPMPNFPDGAFYAVHDDGNVVAFAWHDLAAALDLRTGC